MPPGARISIVAAWERHISRATRVRPAALPAPEAVALRTQPRSASESWPVVLDLGPINRPQPTRGSRRSTLRISGSIVGVIGGARAEGAPPRTGCRGPPRGGRDFGRASGNQGEWDHRRQVRDSLSRPGMALASACATERAVDQVTGLVDERMRLGHGRMQVPRLFVPRGEFHARAKDRQPGA